MHSIRTTLNAAVASLNLSSSSPLLDAEILLCQVLNRPRSYLRAWPDTKLNAVQLGAFSDLLKQRQHGHPIAYLTGIKEFWSREFIVTPDVLIPRPDTECLIEVCLALVQTQPRLRLIDLGTGSGIIAITLAAERPDASVFAADISASALVIAQLNAQRHHVNIQFFQSDWFTAIPVQAFDLVVSNPPYIASDDDHLQQGDLRFEPQQALIAADQGLHDINLLADKARHFLTPNGHLVIEHGYNQAESVQAIFTQHHYHAIQTINDLSGQPRVTFGCYPP
ncbi:MAG: peptide chain release factor N(5)-glutamine methyltransferase [Methylovulum sp.]|nr:peptide chain release factor N(5)-glutamine methyltransferase [Methylovulum sp.]MCF7997526.1 peptide chain release factor N(5)-glutamine methyltransferase [Methylovulum sp.]